jgi:L-fucose mutarotase
MMAPVNGDSLDPNVEQSYEAVLKANSSVFSSITQIERAEFYQRAKGAFAVVMTGETRKYGNVILKKGVTAV